MGLSIVGRECESIRDIGCINLSGSSGRPRAVHTNRATRVSARKSVLEIDLKFGNDVSVKQCIFQWDYAKSQK